MADYDVDRAGVGGKHRFHRAGSEQLVRGAGVGRDPHVHVSLFVRQLVFQLSGQVTGVLRLDEAQCFEIAELKVLREAVERQAIGLVEARAVSAADFEPGPVLGKRRLDRLVQIAFDRCWCAIVVIVVEALLIAAFKTRWEVGWRPGGTGIAPPFRA